MYLLYSIRPLDCSLLYDLQFTVSSLLVVNLHLIFEISSLQTEFQTEFFQATQTVKIKFSTDKNIKFKYQ